MTPISELSNEQLDAKIAQLKGWKLHVCTCNHDFWITPDGGVDYNQSDPPSFTTDPRYAFELLEEMVEACGLIEIDKIDNDVRLCCFDFTDVIAPNLKRAIAEKWAEWKGGE